MSEVPRDNTSFSKHIETGPDYFTYYKHLVLDLLSENGNRFIPFTDVASAVPLKNCSVGEAEGNHNADQGRKVHNFSDSSSYFTEAVALGLSEYKKERLLGILNESVVCFNREVDEVLDQTFAAFQIDSNLRKEYLSAESDEDLSTPLNNKKRKVQSQDMNYSDNNISVIQVLNNIQALSGKDDICQEDVEGYTLHLLAKLSKMEENLEDYMNAVISKSRPMTDIEKHRLGKMMRKLPEKAFNRVVEILQPSNFSADNLPDSIFVNLEEQDNIVLWRLYYYVELVVRANKL